MALASRSVLVDVKSLHILLQRRYRRLQVSCRWANPGKMSSGVFWSLASSTAVSVERPMSAVGASDFPEGELSTVIIPIVKTWPFMPDSTRGLLGVGGMVVKTWPFKPYNTRGWLGVGGLMSSDAIGGLFWGRPLPVAPRLAERSSISVLAELRCFVHSLRE